MFKFQTKILVLEFIALIILFFPRFEVRAESLEGVFKSSVYGAGIGASLGLASWFMTEEKRSKVLWSGILRGSTLGALFGVGYDFLEKEGVLKSSRKDENSQGYLFSWDQRRKSVDFDPLGSLAILSFSFENKYSLRFFRASF